MGILRDKVNQLVSGRKKHKWEILKEKCGDDIAEMIDNNISLRTQIELILESGVVNKLTLSEYYNILKKHFGYEGKKEKARVFEVSQKKEAVKKDVTEKAVSNDKVLSHKRRDTKAELSKDINILKAAGIDVDAVLG